jgi:hypothetical protein
VKWRRAQNQKISTIAVKIQVMVRILYADRIIKGNAVHIAGM